MSAEKKDGGPAFPSKTVSHYVQAAGCVAEPRYELTGGMSLRDWFAGQVLSSLDLEVDEEPGAIARGAYIYADAMLKAREA